MDTFFQDSLKRFKQVPAHNFDFWKSFNIDFQVWLYIVSHLSAMNVRVLGSEYSTFNFRFGQNVVLAPAASITMTQTIQAYSTPCTQRTLNSCITLLTACLSVISTFRNLSPARLKARPRTLHDPSRSNSFKTARPSSPEAPVMRTLLAIAEKLWAMKNKDGFIILSSHASIKNSRYPTFHVNHHRFTSTFPLTNNHDTLITVVLFSVD